MKPFRLNRRSFLGGAGTAISLPLLEAMLPGGKSAFAQADKPTRMLAYFVPNGIHMQSWTPSSTGRNYALTPTLEPLANVKNDLLVLSNLTNNPAKPDGAGDHAAGTGAFITATHVYKTQGSNIRNDISIDQVMANEVGSMTRLRSLELGIDGGGSSGSCDSGYSCAYARNISWAGPQTPLPKMTDPVKVFNRMFAGFDNNATSTEQRNRAALKKSILDSVTEDVRKMSQRLGTLDRQKLDEYLTGIEQLEASITTVDEAVACQVPDTPNSNLGYTQKVSAMTQLMKLAFECDITRVQTFMLSNALSGRVHSHLGINEGHHAISHHQSRQSNYDKLKKIDKWEMEQFADLLESLKNTHDIEGKSLLDSCCVFLSSDISDGNRHNHNNMPVLLAGKANGYFDTGQHLSYSNNTPVSNLFMTMLEAVGTPVSSFGDDSTGILSNLKT